MVLVEWPASHQTKKEKRKTYHAVDGKTSERIAEKNTERTALGERTPDTQEQTSTDRSTEGNELNVTRFQSAQKSAQLPMHSLNKNYIPSGDVAIAIGLFDITKNVSSFTEAQLLDVDGFDLFCAAVRRGRARSFSFLPFLHYCTARHATESGCIGGDSAGGLSVRSGW